MFKKTRSIHGLRMFKANSSRRGTISVEMAMVAPVIFVLVFGSVEFARMMMIRQALTNAARDGCRNACLITTLNSDSADDAVRSTLRAVITNAEESNAIRINIDPVFTSAPESGTTISTSVEVDCADVSWLPPFFTSNAKIRGTASMRRE